MKKLSRILILALVCVMLLSIFTACQKTPASTGGSTSGGGASAGGSTSGGGSASGGSTSGGSTSGGSTSGGSTSGGSTSGGSTAPAEVVSDPSWPTLSVSTFTALAAPSEDGTTQVEEAMNDYLAKLGYKFRININIVNWTDYFTQMDLDLASGNPVDIFLCPNLAQQATNGTLLALDDYFQNELAEACELFTDQWLGCNRYYGHYYGIPTYTCSAETVVYVMRKDILQDIGYTMPESMTLQQLEEMFAKVKAVHPELWCDDAGYYETVMQSMEGKEWGLLSGGTGIRNDNPKTVVNYYASDTYESVLEMTKRWRAAGYTNPEGSTDQTNVVDYVKAGATCGMLAANASTPESVAITYSGLTGRELEATFIINRALASGGFTWSIGYSCKYPHEAAQMLNLFYTDAKFYNMYVYGIEGVDYEWNADHTEIYLPEGLTDDTVPYTYWIGLNVMPNRLLGLPYTGYYNNDDINFLRNRIATVTFAPTFGFTFNTDEVSTQIAAISNVVNQYSASLVHGEIDYLQYLPEFLDALKTAGQQMVIDEAQSQFDDWLAG